MILLTGDWLVTIVGHIYIVRWVHHPDGWWPTFISPIQGSLQAKLDSGGGNISQIAMETERCMGNCTSNCRLTLNGANVTFLSLRAVQPDWTDPLMVIPIP